MATTKTATMYQVRIWPTATAYSKAVSRRLWSRSAKARYVRRLRKCGFDAFAVAMKYTRRA